MSGTNQEKLIPFGNNVVILPIQEEEDLTGGIIIPDSVKKTLQKAVVLSVGPGTKDLPMEAKEGDKVYYQPHTSDVPFKQGEDEVVLLHQSRLIGKFVSI